MLGKSETSYIDDIYESIYVYSENMDFDFLNKLNSKKEIVNWINKLRGRIVMCESEDGVENIFYNYVENG